MHWEGSSFGVEPHEHRDIFVNRFQNEQHLLQKDVQRLFRIFQGRFGDKLVPNASRKIPPSVLQHPELWWP